MSKASFPFVPHLQTTENAPILAFEQTLVEQVENIEQWFRHQWHETPAPFYASCDLRNSGFKLAPVDTNLFPAGFNNLSVDSESIFIHAIQSELSQLCPTACNVLIIAESHTRNLMYLESVCRLRDVISKAGYKVRISNFTTTETLTFNLPSKKSLSVYPLKKENRKVYIDNFTPCIVLLNNDLSSGTPDFLNNINQHIFPPIQLGWQNRTKDSHFRHYEEVTRSFADYAKVDSWLITPTQEVSSGISFKTGQGVIELAETASRILEKTRLKYNEYEIKQNPYVVVKANSGTYGMGVMTIKNPQEIIDANRKQRNKMSVGKEGVAINELLVQEGVPTFEVVGKELSVAEPVVYMLGQYVIGGFYRLHTQKGIDENLNTPGMTFKPLDFNKCINKTRDKKIKNQGLNRFSLYGIIARLALLAAANEAKEISSKSP